MLHQQTRMSKMQESGSESSREVISIHHEESDMSRNTMETESQEHILVSGVINELPLPSLSYRPKVFLEIIDLLLAHVKDEADKEKLKKYLKDIETNIAEIQKYQQRPEEHYWDINNALLTIKNLAGDAYQFSKRFHESLPNTFKKQILELIAPLEEQLYYRLAMTPEQRQELEFKTKKLYAEQSFILNNPGLCCLINQHLEVLKKILKKDAEPKVCYISYAWPLKKNIDREYWVQPFLLILYTHLKAAGIRVIMDIMDNKPGESIYQFMRQYYDGNHVVLVGTDSLREKHYSYTPHAVKTELSIIDSRAEQDAKQYGESRIYPLLISGLMETAYPERYRMYSTVRDGRVGYVRVLKQLIDWIYAGPISHIQIRYDSLWQSFYKQHDQLTKDLNVEREIERRWHYKALDDLKGEMRYKTIEGQMTDETNNSVAIIEMISILFSLEESQNALSALELSVLLEKIFSEKFPGKDELDYLLQLAQKYKERQWLFHSVTCYALCAKYFSQYLEEFEEVSIVCCQTLVQLLAEKEEQLLCMFIDLKIKSVVEFILLLSSRKKLRLDINALVSFKLSEKTALGLACQIGDIDIITLLFKAGAAIEAHSNRETCLHLACESGKVEVVKCLLAQKGVRKIINLPRNCDLTKDTALHIAVKKSCFPIAKILIHAKADPNKINLIGHNVLKELVFSERFQNVQKRDRWVCLLVDRPPALRESFSQRFLENVVQGGFYDFFQKNITITNDNILDLISIACQCIGNSLFKSHEPLYTFREASCKKILFLLLSESKRLELNSKTVLKKLNNFSGNVLCYGAAKGQVDIVQYVLKSYPESILLEFDSGRIALDFAAWNEADSSEVVKCLLDEAPNTVNRYSGNGKTPLHVSVENGRVQVTACLLEYRANPNARIQDAQQNPNLGTPLTLVAESCRNHSNSKRVFEFFSIGILLVRQGADVCLKDNENYEGKTPFEIQTTMNGGGYQELINLFRVPRVLPLDDLSCSINELAALARTQSLLDDEMMDIEDEPIVPLETFSDSQEEEMEYESDSFPFVVEGSSVMYPSDLQPITRSSTTPVYDNIRVQSIASRNMIPDAETAEDEFHNFCMKILTE